MNTQNEVVIDGGRKQYGTKLTAQGEAAIAANVLAGTKLDVVEIAAGDGGGNYYEPTAEQTSLVREVWRGEIVDFTVNPLDPRIVDIKGVIPSSAGGFTVRELGIFDRAGTLIGVCNTPDIEKAQRNSGAGGKLDVIMHLIVTDANALNIVINPSLDTVSLEDVTRLLTGFVADKETQDKIKTDTTAILTELRGQRPKRYGYRVKISEPNPADRVEYLFDAVGMTPAHMDYDGQEFDYGDWKDIWFIRDNYPCMVKADGSEDYRLDPSDYSKKAADGSASDVSSTTYNGNAMAAIPLVWVKRYQEAGYQYVIFCEQQFDEGYKAYAHTRTDGTIAKVAYHALFKGSLVDGKLRSIAGQRPQSSTNPTTELNYAKANGAKWTIKTWSLHSLIADLLTLISKTTASQAAFGQGHTEDGSSAADFLDCGTLKDKGQFFGYSDTAHAMKVFHIENFWGERWDRLVGLIYKNGAFRVKMTPEGAGYNLTGDGYTAIGKGITGQTEVSGSGWQRDTEQTEYGRFPVAPLTGSDATFETDIIYWNNTIVAGALVGSYCNSGSRCGARCLDVSCAAASSPAWNFGASLSLEEPS